MFTKANNNQLTEIDKPRVDWDIDMVSPEEAAGYYDDRIILIPGADEATRQVLLVDIPQSSSLLVQLSVLEPRQRYIRLPTIDIDMVKSYWQVRSTNALATECTWLDVIKLAITAETLQDPVVEMNAIAALKKKGKVAQDNPDVLYSPTEYQVARTHCESTSGESKLLRTLDNIAQTRTGISPPPSQPTRSEPIKDQTTRPALDKYTNSVLRGKGLTGPNKPEPDEKEYSIRQPTIPPSVEVLRSGTVGNFTWPTRNGEKKEG